MIEQRADKSKEGKGRNPYLFVVGCPRSGTTLLQRMLDHHPLLTVANDSHFIPRAIEHVPVGIDPPLTPKLIEWVRTYRRFPRLGLSEDAVYKAADRASTYGEFVSALYEERGRLHEKPLAGEKTPDYCRCLARLHALFPWVRTVHIFRDGRDVALSTLEWAHDAKGPGKYDLWREEPVAVCALWWRWQVTTGRRDGVGLGSERYHEVGYEELIERPEETVRRLASFLDIPFAREMLTYHEGKTRHAPGLSAKKAWLPPTQGLRDWRTQMAERDVELFEALAGDLLSDLGYERAFHALSPETTAIAEQCQQRWESELERKLAKVEGGQRTTRTAGSGACGTRLTNPRRMKPESAMLSPADISLVQRDPALAGLPTLLNPGALVATLRPFFPRADLGSAQITYIRYKPGMNCLVAYQLDAGGSVVELYAKAHGPDADVKLQNAGRLSSLPGPIGAGRIILEDRATVVSFFPNDSKLKSLYRLTDPDVQRRILRTLLPDRPDLWEGALRGLRYKPERRYVAQLVAEDEIRAVLRVYSEPAYRAAQSNANAFESHGALRLAKFLGRSDHHRILALEYVPGRLLSEAISDPGFEIGTLETVGAALAELHGQDPKGLTRKAPEAEAAHLLEVAVGVDFVCPHLDGRARGLAERLAAQLVDEPPPSYPVHGDFYADQVLLGSDTVAILDFDRAARGDPATDLGNFIAHLEHATLQGELSPTRVESLRDALLAGYHPSAHDSNAARLDLYTAAGLLRLAPDPFRRHGSDWPERTEAILERAEAAFKRAESCQVFR